MKNQKMKVCNMVGKQHPAHDCTEKMSVDSPTTLNAIGYNYGWT